jgi:hypothetical protein
MYPPGFSQGQRPIKAMFWRTGTWYDAELATSRLGSEKRRVRLLHTIDPIDDPDVLKMVSEANAHMIDYVSMDTVSQSAAISRPMRLFSRTLALC